MSKLYGNNEIITSSLEEEVDLFELKLEMLEEIDHSYTDSAIGNERYREPYYYNDQDYVKDDENYDYYNGYYIDEYGEVMDEDEDPLLADAYNYNSDEPIALVGTCETLFLKTGVNHSIYQCDQCGTKFLDYNQYYSNNRYESKLLNKKNLDVCSSCYEDIKREFFKDNIIEASSSLFSEGSIGTSKQQKHICNLLDGQLNIRIGNFFVDILIDNIVVEYDGSGHWLGTYFKNKTISEIDSEDNKRDKYLNSLGYKVLRIVSEKDYLPSDKDILTLFNSAKESFKTRDQVKVNVNKDSFEYLRKL